MLSIANVLFTVFHLALTLFNLTGWAWKQTRKLHLVVLVATAASWFLLGIWYGWGYCPLTAWHWDVKEKLGEKNLPNSFIKYHADRWTGYDIPASVVDTVTLAGLILAALATVYVNFFRGKVKRRRR
jgi:hypothetical protein